MSDELLNHQHCRICDRALPFGDNVCEDHKPEWTALQKKRRRTVMLFYVAVGVMAIVLLQQIRGAL